MGHRVLLAGLISIITCACSLLSFSPTSTATFIPTATASKTPLSLPTITPTVTPVQLYLPITDQLVNVRFGAGVLYVSMNELQDGQSARVIGRNDTSTWWYIRAPGNPDGLCWVSADVTKITGDSDALPIFQPPVTAVTGLDLVVEPNRIVVDCTQFPQTFFFEAQVTANGPTLVHWPWEASTGICPANRAQCVRLANFIGNLRISASLIKWNRINCMHGISLEWD